MSQLKQITLDNLAGGAASEIFERELNSVARNIADQNTDPKKTRKIVLTISFTPDENREEVKLSVSAKATIVPVKPANKTIHLGKLDGKPTLFANNQRQGEFNFESNGVSQLGAKNA